MSTTSTKFNAAPDSTTSTSSKVNPEAVNVIASATSAKAAERITFFIVTLAAETVIAAVVAVVNEMVGLSEPEPKPIIATPATSQAIDPAALTVSVCPGITIRMSPLEARHRPIA